ncbi:MAG: hypothetical protein FD174_1009 [Geobacteraceae bacterium]|nr:MAG: hypothetical protein FD174_1009 [Geobacteraceae bacterium]
MSNRTDILYVRDIIESIEAILDYTRSITYEAFSTERMRYSAVIREFEIIGEAIGKLPENLKDEYPLVPWQDIKDFRNLLIHEYFGVDLEIVWNVVENDLPKLFEVIKAIEASLTA